MSHGETNVKNSIRPGGNDVSIPRNSHDGETDALLHGRDQTRPKLRHPGLLQSYMDAVPLPVALVDTVGRCLKVNKAAWVLFSAIADPKYAAPEEDWHIYGADIHDFFTLPQDFPRAAAWSNLPPGAKLRIGAMIRPELRKKAYFDVSRQESGFLMICTKTETVRLRNGKENPEKRLAFIQEVGGISLWDWSPVTGRIAIASGENSSLFPHEEANFEPGTLARLVHPRDIQKLRDAFPNKAYAEGRPVEIRILSGEGRWNWVLMRGRATELAKDGSPLRYKGIMLDVNRRKLREQRAELFLQVAQAAQQAKSIRRYFTILCDILEAQLDVAALSVYLCGCGEDENKLFFHKDLWPIHHIGKKKNTHEPLLPALERVCDTKRTTRLNKAHIHAIRPGSPIGCWTGIPIRSCGEFIGVLGFARPKRSAMFSKEEEKLLRVVADLTATTLVRVNQQENLVKRALYDGLTQLPNRELLAERFDQAMKRSARTPGQNTAVVLLDLDHFKSINDTYGHAAGDEALRAVAKTVPPLLRGTDTLARFGGDEFAILLENVQGPAQAVKVGRRILNAIRQKPIMVDETPVSLSVSMGMVLNAENCTDMPEAFSRADLALYRVKQRGRGTLRVYTERLAREQMARPPSDEKAITTPCRALLSAPGTAPGAAFESAPACLTPVNAGDIPANSRCRKAAQNTAQCPDHREQPQEDGTKACCTANRASHSCALRQNARR